MQFVRVLQSKLGNGELTKHQQACETGENFFSLNCVWNVNKMRATRRLFQFGFSFVKIDKIKTLTVNDNERKIEVYLCHVQNAVQLLS